MKIPLKRHFLRIITQVCSPHFILLTLQCDSNFRQEDKQPMYVGTVQIRRELRVFFGTKLCLMAILITAMKQKDEQILGNTVYRLLHTVP